MKRKLAIATARVPLIALQEYSWALAEKVIDGAYGYQMGLRPQTLYGIADSPVGLAAYFLDHDARSYELISRVFAGESAGLTRDDVPWLYSMWEGKALWWLVQWPVLGHGNAHVGEGISVRNRMGLSPF